MKTQSLQFFNKRSLIGFYFHIPFCPHICSYCNFVKTSLFKKRSVLNYLALCKESLEEHLENIPEHFKDATIYFGGGTPGLFQGKYYKDMVRVLERRFQIQEFTIETNPYTNILTNLESYKELGANRLTLGAQSLNSTLLKTLGRRHSIDDILKNLKEARKIGFNNIQMDLIFGVSQSEIKRDLKHEVEIAIESGATGISSYLLTLEKNTAFSKNPELCADEDKSFKEYDEIHEVCSKLGLNHVETSNYSFFEMLHNSVYWHGLPYIGIGVGAHCLLPPSENFPFGRRYHVGPKNHSFRSLGDIEMDFEEQRSSKDIYFKVNFEKTRTLDDYISELVFSLLRTERGLEKPWLEDLKKGLFRYLIGHPKILKGRECSQISIINDCLILTTYGKFLGDKWALDIIALTSLYLKT